MDLHSDISNTLLPHHSPLRAKLTTGLSPPVFGPPDSGGHEFRASLRPKGKALESILVPCRFRGAAILHSASGTRTIGRGQLCACFIGTEVHKNHTSPALTQRPIHQQPCYRAGTLNKRTVGKGGQNNRNYCKNP